VNLVDEDSNPLGAITGNVIISLASSSSVKQNGTLRFLFFQTPQQIIFKRLTFPG
jgi:hypothetical protein